MIQSFFCIPCWFKWQKDTNGLLQPCPKCGALTAASADRERTKNLKYDQRLN